MQFKCRHMLMACTFYRHATDIRLQRCASIDQVWKRLHACVQKYFSAVKRSILNRFHTGRMVKFPLRVAAFGRCKTGLEQTVLLYKYIIAE